jgi:hypothetical protein
MKSDQSATKACDLLMTGFWLILVVLLIPRQIGAQNKIIAAYTLPEIPIKAFQNTIFPESVANDHGVLLGSVGSDLWRGPNDGPGEFWMLTDRGPNGQIREKSTGVSKG